MLELKLVEGRLSLVDEAEANPPKKTAGILKQQNATIGNMNAILQMTDI